MTVVTEALARLRYSQGMLNRETNLQELSTAYSQFLSQANQNTLQELETALQITALFAVHSKRTR